jgi:hypothetical protein
LPQAFERSTDDRHIVTGPGCLHAFDEVLADRHVVTGASLSSYFDEVHDDRHMVTGAFALALLAVEHRVLNP